MNRLPHILYTYMCVYIYTYRNSTKWKNSYDLLVARREEQGGSNSSAVGMLYSLK